jgi:hypothetical protein
MYYQGMKVCLWEIKHQSGTLVVLDEVVVEIIETKTGALGEWSKTPTNSQSLRARSEDGREFFKHWERWPESQTCDFLGQWSLRDDSKGDKGDPFWAPHEAVYVVNQINHENKRRKNRSEEEIKLFRHDGTEAIPSGDIGLCEEHNEYFHKGQSCFYCEYPKAIPA